MCIYIHNHTYIHICHEKRYDKHRSWPKILGGASMRGKVITSGMQAKPAAWKRIHGLKEVSSFSPSTWPVWNAILE